MTIPNAAETGAPAAAPNETPAVAPPAPAPAAAPPAPAKAEPATAAPSAASTEEKVAPPAPAIPVLDAESDEIPENDELFQLSKKALNARLTRHTKRELRDRFGTDDFDQIKIRLDKLALFEQEAEAKRLAALSELEREREERQKAEDRARKAEEAYQRSIDAQTFAEYDKTASAALSKHFDSDPDVQAFVTERLKKHVLSLEDGDLKDPQKVFDAWAKEYAAKHPRYAKREEQAPEPKKIALNTGADTERPEREPQPNMRTKTAKPGQANTMSRAEYAAYKRSVGLGG